MNTSQCVGMGIVLTLGLAFLGALFWFEPNGQSFYPVCLFHQTTGWQCPGCGSLRAMHQLLHGHFGAAFHLNPLLVILLPILVGYGALCVWRAARRQPVILPLRPVWWWLALLVTLGFGLWRNWPGAA